MTFFARSRTRLRASFALMAFVAATLVAAIAPLAQAHGYEEVCSAQGPKRIAVDVGQGQAPADHGAHCPLCMPVGAPPAEITWDFTPVLVRSPDRPGIPSTRTARLDGAAFPARGPPSAS